MLAGSGRWLGRPAINALIRHGDRVLGTHTMGWQWPLRAWVAELHAPFITDFTGFDQPWRLLAEYAPDLRVRELAFGAGYLALGHTR